ncbi:MAG: cytidylyltransferase domain-containing protein [Pirellulaceae bacterium]
MSSTLGIVEVPSTLSRPLAGQAPLPPPAARRFGDHSVLEWIVRRITESLLLDQVAVVTDAAQGKTILRLAPPDAAVFISKQPDALSRFAAAIRHYDARQVVRVPLSSPFVDPELIDRLIGTASANPDSDYIGYATNRGGPAVLSRLGVFTEWCRAEAILRADREATRDVDRAKVTRFVYSQPEIFKLRLVPIPPRLDRDDFRLTVHSEEDWDNAHTIFDALGAEALDWQRIAGLLDQQPALRERMAVLNEAERTAH